MMLYSEVWESDKREERTGCEGERRTGCEGERTGCEGERRTGCEGERTGCEGERTGCEGERRNIINYNNRSCNILQECTPLHTPSLPPQFLLLLMW